MTKDIKGINEAFLQYCFNHYKCKTISELSRATNWRLEAISRVRNGKNDVPFKWELDSSYSELVMLEGSYFVECKDVYGKYLQEVKYKDKTYNSRASIRYKSIIARCTEGSAFQKKYPYYKGVTSEFKDFQHFAEWSSKQVGSYLPDYDIDKDLLSGNNKIYSPDTCLYLPRRLNRSISVRQTSELGMLKGVTKRIQCGKTTYVAAIREGSKLKYLGSFKDEESAYLVFKEAYNNRILGFVEEINSGGMIVDSRVAPALEKYLLK